MRVRVLRELGEEADEAELGGVVGDVPDDGLEIVVVGLW